MHEENAPQTRLRGVVQVLHQQFEPEPGSWWIQPRGALRCLKTQSGHLLQGPQTPILANNRGKATLGPFAAASTCSLDPINATPALTYHDSASADRTGDEDVATSSNVTERC